jgi:hypothetical protein
MRVAQLMMSLPLFFFATQLAQPLSLAQAAAMDPAEATTLLSKSHSVNVKCKFLAVDQGQHLRDLVARAEISLAEKASVSVARNAIAAGRSQAQTIACDETNRKTVNDVLAAASAAITSAVAIEPPVATAAVVEPPKSENKSLAVIVPTVKPAKQLASVQKTPIKPQIAIIRPQKPAGRVKTATGDKTKKSLGGYAQVAETYYTALRCGTMSRSEISSLYQTVLASHQQALSNNRPAAVKSMLLNAEARADGHSCS